MTICTQKTSRSRVCPFFCCFDHPNPQPKHKFKSIFRTRHSGHPSCLRRQSTAMHPRARNTRGDNKPINHSPDIIVCMQPGQVISRHNGRFATTRTDSRYPGNRVQAKQCRPWASTSTSFPRYSQNQIDVLLASNACTNQAVSSHPYETPSFARSGWGPSPPPPPR